MQLNRILTILGGILQSLVLFFVFVQSIEAASFPADYDVYYSINASGVTTVQENISITNETDSQYPSQYTLALEGISIRNVQANDALGPMEVLVEERDGFTLVTVSFNQIVLGRGNTLLWSLQYETDNITEKKGTVWEVTLPQIQPDERISSYRITVNAPVELGELDYSDPLPVSYQRDDSNRQLTYVFDQPIRPISVVMAFGERQLIDLELYYHLENTQKTRGLIEIALPPTQFPYQKTYISKLEPEPYSIEIDPEGNVLAQYLVNPGEVVDVHFVGQAWINQKTLSEISSPIHLLPSEELTEQDLYWEINSNEVTEVVKEILSTLPESATDLEKAKVAYEYIVDLLEYDTTQLENPQNLDRSGAVHALNHPSEAICTDFTDVLITVLRAMGIPAREVNGYAFSESSEELPTVTDVLHAWVQIYIPDKGWIQVDPTWGSTANQNYFDRFDTNHVIFVLKGLDSQYPYPAGSYKVKDQVTEDVFVSYAETYQQGSIPLTLWVQQKQEASSPLDFLDWLFIKFLELV